MWKSFSETLRECGQNATLFIFVILLIGVCGLCLQRYSWVILPSLLVFCLARIWAFTRQQSRRAKLEKFPPLSDNEREVARTKLLRLNNPK